MLSDHRRICIKNTRAFRNLTALRYLFLPIQKEKTCLKKKWIAWVAFLAAMAACVCVDLFIHHAKPIDLKYRDLFPDSIAFYSLDNQKHHISEFRGKYKAVFYLSPDDSDLYNRLRAIKNIMLLYHSNDISYVLLWTGSIPKQLIASVGMDVRQNFYLKKGVSICEYEPNAFLLGTDNRIAYASGYSFSDLSIQIYGWCHKNDLIKKVDLSIIHDGGGAGSSKPYLLMFITSGCHECKQQEPLFKSLIAQARNTYHVITIRPDYDQPQAYDQNLCIDYSLVYFDIFKKTNHVIKTPFFVLLDKSGSLTKTFYDVNQTIEFVRN